MDIVFYRTHVVTKGEKMDSIKRVILVFTMSMTLIVTNAMGDISTGLKQVLLDTDPHTIKHQPIMRNFYATYGYRPLWITSQNFKKEKIKSLLNRIKRDPTLSHSGYIYKEMNNISHILKGTLNQKSALKLELRLTALYYEFLQHSIYGEIDWKGFNSYLKEKKEKSDIDGKWINYAPRFDIMNLLAQDSIDKTIESVKPKHYRYQNLVDALPRLYDIQRRGGWKKLTNIKNLKLWKRRATVPLLRERLKISGDYKSCKKNFTGVVFDRCLDKALKHFQNRHGLVPNGIVDTSTQNALNQTVWQKINTVLLNIDRIKWLPREKGSRYIIVNIPDFMLSYIEDYKVKKTLKVIVGKPTHPTPIFSNKISYIVLNPYWKIPESIVRKEVVPAMIKNPNYIKRKGIEVHKTWEENSSIMPIDDIVWSDYLKEDKKFPYRLMNPPGPRNALGKIKFKFPNRFNVYLHDTPNKKLFNRNSRAFSHGCIRLHKPQSLLTAISTVDNSINLPEAQQILRGKNKETIHIDQKIPIHLVYLTAGVNPQNELIFRDDIYRYDKEQKRTVR